MDDRRSSRIPGSGIPRPTASGGSGAVAGSSRPLTERATNTSGDRKRRADVLDPIVEPSKRQASAGPTAARPTRSAPHAPGSSAAQQQPSQSFQSEGAQRAQPGPGPGEETFEDIHARTGASEEDILGKKMSFRKGLKPEKKVEEMAPMIKELRAVGWHLLSGRQKAQMDAEQWKGHSEQAEAELAASKQEWSQRQDAIEAQIKEMQEMLKCAEAITEKLTGELAAAEQLVNERSSALGSAQQQLASTTEHLEAARATLKDKDSKIREMEEVVRQSQSYSSTLQSYNTSLQNDLKEEKAKRDEASKERDMLQGRAAELGGQVKSLEHQLGYEKEQVAKLRVECEVSSRDVVALRADLDTTRQERERLLADCARLTAELERIRSVGGKSLETMEALTNDKATLEVQLATQQRLLGDMRQELAVAKEARAAAESTSTNHSTQVVDLSTQVAALREALASAEDKVLRGEMVRRKLHNIIQELKGNIRVFCRVRPCNTVDAAAGGEQPQEGAGGMAVDFPPSTDVLGAGIILQVPARSAGMEGAAAPSRHSFTFDKVFSPDSCQEGVFEEISELVQSALDGHKVCIFAYGQTGSGKTYTMLGTDEQPGIIPRAMLQIFDTSCKLGSQGWTFTMQASMLEIYNEEYKDLLARRKGAAAAAAGDKKHNVVHNSDGSTTVSEMTSVDVTSMDKVESLLSQAMERRSVASTQLNEHSSRSHMVFTLKIDGTNATTGQTIAGVLNLVDLAGSERIKESGATGQQLKEAQAINKSLSALGDVIAAIASKEKHVPFRNSKLTYLLQNCLGGDAKTLMFVNVAPTREFAGESLCSLRFAAKVNACEINPKRQVTK